MWIRNVVHVVRDAQGEVDALIGFMFDISERKITEEKLITLQKVLEVLSFKDSLTGVASTIPTHKDEAVMLIDEVDKRLYQAKQEGRNCISEGS